MSQSTRMTTMVTIMTMIMTTLLTVTSANERKVRCPFS